MQAENAAAYPSSIEAGEPVTVHTKPTIADGIAVARPGDLNFPIIRDLVDDIVTVSDDDVARALLVLLERAKLVVEPAVPSVSRRSCPAPSATPGARSSCSAAATSTRS